MVEDLDMNRLLFGDNSRWLQDRKILPDASVDLVYLDPPFNSNAEYNVLFRESSGEASQAQFHAFTDTWSWVDAAQTYNEFVSTSPNIPIVEMIRALHSFLRNSPMMAYLVMMAPRLVELHRVLKPTGSLYLHCDPTASHYLKVLLDELFGPENFRNEIIWKRSSSHADTKQGMRRCGRIHDVILLYSRSKDATWNPVYTPYDDEYVESMYRFVDEEGRRYREGDLTAARPGGDVSYEWRVKRKHGGKERWVADLDDEYRKPRKAWEYLGVRPYKGRFWAYAKDNMIEMWKEGRIIHRGTGFPQYKRYLDEQPGIPLQDLWLDINPLSGSEKERLGFPTQKPMALIERIIQASSNPGDLVLDPFCGCGTSVHAAQKLDRKWIGIDLTYLAINLIKRRLRDAFGKRAKYEESGQPTDLAGAKRLAELDKFQFQQWALSLIEARPLRENYRGADRGVDGVLYFPEGKTEHAKILVQVKGGAVKRGDVATLIGDVNNQKAAAGVLITLEEPTKSMLVEAADAGRYSAKLYNRKKFPKIQILTIEGLLDGAERLEAPPTTNFFAKAEQEGENNLQQTECF
jgi:adenine specific DNA methylase Mod